MSVKTKNNWHYAYISFGSFSVGLLISIIEGTSFDNYDDHTLILVPIILPLLGMFFSIRGIFMTKGSARLTRLILGLFFLMNLGLAAIIFIAYSFSYWQF